MVRLFVFAIGVTLTSLLLGAVGSMYIPVVIEGEANVKITTDKAYSVDELNRLEKKMDERLEQLRKEPIGGRGLSALTNSRVASIWFVWLPWLVFPFFLKSKPNIFVLLLTLIAPILLVVINLMLPVEIIIYAVALLAGAYLRGLVKQGLKGPGSI